MKGLDRLNVVRRASSEPITAVDLALHLGEVLYGNVGAFDRLDFTAIGPAVNEVIASRLVRASEWQGAHLRRAGAAVVDGRRLEPLGYHMLRAVREPRDLRARS